MELSEEQKSLLHKLYYNESMFLGRDKLFQYVKFTYPESGISRRNLMFWLKQQKVWQKTAPPPPRQRISAISADTVGGFQFDLAGPLHRDKGYNYYCALIEIATRKLYTRPLKNKSAIDTRDALKDIIDVCLHNSKRQCTEMQGEFSTFLLEKGIKQIFSKPHSPWEMVLLSVSTAPSKEFCLK